MFSKYNLSIIRCSHNEPISKNSWTAFVSPSAKKKVFQPDLEKIKRLQAKKLKIIPKTEKVISSRYNQFDIQMLPIKLYNQVFKNYTSNTCNRDLILNCKRTLEKHGMVNKEMEFVPEVDIKLPLFEGNNLEEHFFNIAEQQSKPYRELVEKVIKYIPPKPLHWAMLEGWVRYIPNHPPEKVDYPLEDDLIFDVEVCMANGKAPTLATAVSSKAWYGWVSQSLLDAETKPVTNHQYNEDILIPIESGKNNTKKDNIKSPRLIIGHNVSYDRTKIKEQYWLDSSGLRFVDTMSLHICVSGLTSYQRAVLKSKTNFAEDTSWKDLGSLNSLSEVHKLYCQEPLEKDVRNLFVKGTLSDIRSEFQEVMNYCSEDVKATQRVLKELYPIFCERFPHPVTFAGMLELGVTYLPVNNNWVRYLEDSELTYEEMENEGKLLLARRADQACHLLHDDKYKEDIWMWDQDWEVKQLKIKKNLPIKKIQKKELQNTREQKEDNEDLDPNDIKFQYLEEINASRVTHLPGYPNWYKKLCEKPEKNFNWIPGPHLISTSMRITPKLLNLTWEGYPLHYIIGEGWGLLVPFSLDCEDKQIPLKQLLQKCPLPPGKENNERTMEYDIRKDVQNNLAKKEYYSRIKQDKTGGIYNGSAIWCNTILENCVYFFKLPHKDGIKCNVGNPLAKDFLNKFSENVLAGDTESAERVLSIARMLSYWRNNKDRINEQMVVWLNKTNLSKDMQNKNYGAILPQVVICGTLTRRAVEPTWMTASNAHKERIGSELRSMIQAPPGYKIIGADVDSQELWIASVIGDASHAKMHGATPFGWMTLSGSKANGTDMHSVTAKAVGISRDHAKVINYARIYGAGQSFAESLLRQFNPELTQTEARSKAQKMFTLTKGKLIYKLRQEYLHDIEDIPYSKWQAFELSKAFGKSISELFYKPKWVGGTESAMFNRLEEIAGSLSPTTPFLESRLTRTLEPKNLPDDRFLPTRVNWVVQSGAVDYLHLMLVCMKWLTKNSNVRFCLSFHDEIRYLVPEDKKYEVALAMHITNLLTRAFCSIRLGIYDLPYSVAFFSAVEIDNVLRKESKDSCKTPSNPHGLEKGYGIPNGESLNIFEVIKKVNEEKNVQEDSSKLKT